MDNNDEIEIRRSGLDHSYIKHPHQYSLRRFYSITGADWEQRINGNYLGGENIAGGRK